MAVNLSLDEQETHINMCRADKTCSIYTSDTKMRNRLNKLYPDKLVRTFKQDGEIVAEEYCVDMRLVTFKSKLPEPHPLTEEQRQERRERMLALREKMAKEKKEGK